MQLLELWVQSDELWVQGQMNNECNEMTLGTNHINYYADDTEQ